MAPLQITINKPSPPAPPTPASLGPINVAKLIVDGREYVDWETISVKQELHGNPPQTARFTCSEGSPLVDNWMSQQIMPGQSCQVILSGQLAFNGKVYSRQVFVDARRHQIEIQCAN